MKKTNWVEVSLVSAMMLCGAGATAAGGYWYFEYQEINQSNDALEAYEARPDYHIGKEQCPKWNHPKTAPSMIRVATWNLDTGKLDDTLKSHDTIVALRTEFPAINWQRTLNPELADIHIYRTLGYELVTDKTHTGAIALGVACSNKVWYADIPGYQDGSTQVLYHEVGHYLGLCHTHKGTVMDAQVSINDDHAEWNHHQEQIINSWTPGHTIKEDTCTKNGYTTH